jgi:hypothetical protein
MGDPRPVSYHMVEVIDPKFCSLSSKSSDGYFSSGILLKRKS